MLAGLFRKILSACSPNDLEPFEANLLSQLTRKEYHNIGFISLKHQILEMLRYQSLHYGRIGGTPDWFSRSWEGGSVVIKPKRFIGADYGFSSSLLPLYFAFPLLFESGWLGSLAIRLSQTVEELRISGFQKGSITRTYPKDVHGRVLDCNIFDERDYWKQRSESASSLGQIPKEVQEIVETNSFRKNVIIVDPGNWTTC